MNGDGLDTDGGSRLAPRFMLDIGNGYVRIMERVGWGPEGAFYDFLAAFDRESEARNVLAKLNGAYG